MKILGEQQACQAAEVAMLQAQEKAADFDAQASVLEALAQDASEDAAADAAISEAAEGGVAHNTSPRFGCLHT